MEILTLDILNAVINSIKYSDLEKYNKIKTRVFLSLLIGEKIDENIIFKLFVAALLKDIGQIGSEKNNTIYKSAEIIRGIPEILPFQYGIADIILESEERIDGSGFPAGKKEISEEAQIIGLVCDYIKSEDKEEVFNNKEKYKEKYMEILKKILEEEKNIEILNDEKELEKILQKNIKKYNVYKEKIEGVEEEQFLMTIASIIDAKDKYTGGHTKRVASYSYLIAKELNYSEEKLSKIRYAAYLHDIGKLAIDGEILNKPGKLTKEEFEIIKSHARYSFYILWDSPSLRQISFGALHHEKLDGTGYPMGFKKGWIPEGAQIIALADILDALTSDRLYRKPSTFKEAFKMMGEMVEVSFEKKIFEAAKICFDM